MPLGSPRNESRPKQRTKLAGGIVTSNGKWIPRRNRGCVQQNVSNEPWVRPASVPANSSMHRQYNETLDDATLPPPHTQSLKDAHTLCDVSASGKRHEPALTRESQLQPPARPKLQCSDSAARVNAAGVTVLIGIHTSPGAGLPRRTAIRETWMKWDMFKTLTCFLIGSVGLDRQKRESVESEAALHGDIKMLPATDGCVLSIPKCYAWWRAAAAYLQPSGSIQFVGKADDDVFINMPNFHQALSGLSCLPHVSFGAHAAAGYRPTDFRKCGWSWGGRRAWNSYGCRKHGAYPAFPFALGQLQVLSADLVRRLAESPEVQSFVSRADAQIDLRKWDKAEDIAFGFLLSRLQADQGLDIHFVSVLGRARNLGCRKNGGLYVNPTNESIAVHFVKKPLGHHYLWDLFRFRQTHNVKRCMQMAGID